MTGHMTVNWCLIGRRENSIYALLRTTVVSRATANEEFTTRVLVRVP